MDPLEIGTSKAEDPYPPSQDPIIVLLLPPIPEFLPARDPIKVLLLPVAK